MTRYRQVRIALDLQMFTMFARNMVMIAARLTALMSIHDTSLRSAVQTAFAECPWRDSRVLL